MSLLQKPALFTGHQIQTKNEGAFWGGKNLCANTLFRDLLKRLKHQGKVRKTTGGNI